MNHRKAPRYMWGAFAKRFNTMKKIYFLFAAILGIAFSGQAQQQAMFTQYMFNGLLLNPAYAGSHETVSFTGVGRRQWVGFDGAPDTESFSVHAPIRKGKIGLGFYFINDRIGVTNEYSYFGSASYRLQLNKGYLSFGLQFGLLNHRTDFDRLTKNDDDDINLIGSVVDILKPNVGAGLYYNTERFYVGFAVPHILTNDFVSEGGQLVYDQERHFYLTSGAVFDLNHWLKFKPSLLFKAVPGAPVELDLNGNFLLNNVLWVGAGLRSYDSVHLMTQLQLTNQFAVGYTFDLTTTELRRENSGTHEIMLNYRFNFNRKRIITPRYF